MTDPTGDHVKRLTLIVDATQEGSPQGRHPRHEAPRRENDGGAGPRSRWAADGKRPHLYLVPPARPDSDTGPGRWGRSDGRPVRTGERAPVPGQVVNGGSVRTEERAPGDGQTVNGGRRAAGERVPGVGQVVNGGSVRGGERGPGVGQVVNGGRQAGGERRVVERRRRKGAPERRLMDDGPLRRSGLTGEDGLGDGRGERSPVSPARVRGLRRDGASMVPKGRARAVQGERAPADRQPRRRTRKGDGAIEADAVRARRRVVVPGTPAQLGRPRMGWFPRFARIDRTGRAAQGGRTGRAAQVDRAGRATQVDRVGRSAGADSGRRARVGKRLRGSTAETAPVRLTRRGRAALVLVMALLSLGGFWLGTRAAGRAEAERPPGTVGPSWAQVREGHSVWNVAGLPWSQVRAGAAGPSWVQVPEVDNLGGAGAYPGEDPGAVADETRRVDGLTSPPRRTGTRLHGPAASAPLYTRDNR